LFFMSAVAASKHSSSVFVFVKQLPLQFQFDLVEQY
jgi:hypothetical protein